VRADKIEMSLRITSLERANDSIIVYGVKAAEEGTSDLATNVGSSSCGGLINLREWKIDFGCWNNERAGG